jgi:hypothetical protein
MTFIKIILVGMVLLIAGGFAYFAIIDVPVKQTEKTIPLSASDFATQ